jgi:hypothetical protein
VKNYTFHFEIKDLLTQFVAAFDNIVIKRFNKIRIPENHVQVRYVYAPKQRVIYDLVNKAQNLTLPVVAVNISNVTRDENRVFNKNSGYYLSRGATETDYRRFSEFYRMPVPVNIGINMSFIAKFQSDMDQIISNFVPYSNPYIILSWKLPEVIASGVITPRQEIRSEVLWDGSLNLSYPTDIAANDKYRIVCDTTFLIKGWLFPAVQNPAGNIYFIDSNFRVSSILTTYESLSNDTFIYPVSSGLVNEIEVVSLSGNPQISNVDYTI